MIVNPVPAAEVPDDAGETKRPFATPEVRALVEACNPSRWPAGDKALPRLADWKTVILFGALYASVLATRATSSGETSISRKS